MKSEALCPQHLRPAIEVVHDRAILCCEGIEAAHKSSPVLQIKAKINQHLINVAASHYVCLYTQQRKVG